MKRAKFVLTAVIALVVAGGTLAFETNMLTGKRIYTDSDSNGTCDAQVTTAFYKTTLSGGEVLNATFVQDANCASIRVTTTTED